jgi:DNA-binding MarR family transcriptional regulator
VARVGGEMSEELEACLQRIALHFEASGLPRTAGLILAHLLTCEPPHASVTELAERLGISMGSASTMTRMLSTTGLVEKVGLPGSRMTYFRLADDGFERMFAGQSKLLASFGPLAEEGVRLLGSERPERGERLRSMQALYAFYERELPLLAARWREERERLRDAPKPT